MTIKGLEPLLEMRKAGKLPGKSVLLLTDKEPFAWARYGDALSVPEGRVTLKDDMRVLIRLDVILVANKFTAEVAAILEKVKQEANSVIFVSLDADDGTVWDREGGEREL